jgi:hypothetical protein
MHKAAILGALMVLGACAPVPIVSVPLSEPAPALFETRLSGVWYSGTEYRQSEGPTFGQDAWRPGNDILQFVPNRDGSSFKITSLAVLQRGGDSVESLEATAHASRLDDGEIIYYNVEFQPERLLVVGVKITGDSTLFLHFMNANLIKNLADSGRIRVQTEQSEALHTPVAVIDGSREELVALIREIGPSTLFSEVRGPFHRIPGTPHDVVAASAGEPIDQGEAFGAWEVVQCHPSSPPGCHVRDKSQTVSVIRGLIRVREDRCQESEVEMRVDDKMFLRTAPDGSINTIAFIEQMLLGRILHLSYPACPGNEMRQLDVSLEGFGAAYNAARNEWAGER